MTTNVLECADLRKSFGDLAAVDGVGFHIAPGETYGLLGPNGAGKDNDDLDDRWNTGGRRRLGDRRG